MKNVAATGWLTVGLLPVSRMTSAYLASAKTSETAPEPIPSSSAATLEAWHSRVQWSTLLVPRAARISFWKRYASSLLHLADPNPASARGPCSALISSSRDATRSRASSHVASRNAGITWA